MKSFGFGRATFLKRIFLRWAEKNSLWLIRIERIKLHQPPYCKPAVIKFRIRLEDVWLEHQFTHGRTGCHLLKIRSKYRTFELSAKISGFRHARLLCNTERPYGNKFTLTKLTFFCLLIAKCLTQAENGLKRKSYDLTLRQTPENFVDPSGIWNHNLLVSWAVLCWLCYRVSWEQYVSFQSC